MQIRPTCIDTVVQIDQRLFGGLQSSLDNGFLALDVPLSKPLGKLFSCRGVPNIEVIRSPTHLSRIGHPPNLLRSIIEDNEALHPSQC